MNILFINPNYPGRAKSYLILPSLEISIMSSLLEIHGHKTFMLDLIIVCTPLGTKFDIFETILSFGYRGKFILEKPITTDFIK